jgi:hypothetical protein
MHTQFLSEKVKGREPWEIILGTILGNWGVKCGQDSSGSVKDPVAGSHEHRNKPCRKRLYSNEPGIAIIAKLKMYNA